MFKKIAMAESKTNMDKKKPRFEKSKGVSLFEKKEIRMKSKKLKQKRKKRLIIRNLSFKVSEEELKKIFSEFGEVTDVKIPVNEAGRKRGFAFVQYNDSKSQIKAMKALNFKEINGRPVAIDFAVDKTTYQSKKNSNESTSKLSKKIASSESKYDSDSDSEDDKKPEIRVKEEKSSDSGEEIDSDEEEDNKVNQFLKEFNADEEPEENVDDSESSDSSDDSDVEEKESLLPKKEDKNIEKAPYKKKQSADVSEGKTVFIRNVSYNSNEEDLKEIMQEYGELVYCLLCMDRYTDHPKGTAFVKFKEKESADKLVEKSAEEPGVILDGRKLNCIHALSRDELSKQDEGSEKDKDKRNLKLLKCGLVMHGSKESEGVTQTDMAKRAQLETEKKTKLKNVNFFVSNTRLAIHNLPKNISDQDLRIMFKKAAGKDAVIKEARVMKDFKKTDSRGIPVSRGFGFVSFTKHEHALKALEELNNNPKIFTASKRPIVEFSIENKVALLSQERKREKLKQLHKRKLEEKEAKNNQANENGYQRETESSTINFKIPGKRKAGNKSHRGKKRKLNNSIQPTSPEIQKTASKKKQIPGERNADNKSHRGKKWKPNNSKQPTSPEIQKTTSKKKQKKNRRNKKKQGNAVTSQEKNSLSVLTNKYKEKLLNKIS